MADQLILCVDDDSTILNSISLQLQSTFGDQYLYEFAESAEEAKEVIDEVSEEGCDVVFVMSDWLMPGMKGDEFLIELHKTHPRTVKVLLSGQAEPDAVVKAHKEADLHKYLLKPWSEKELIETITSGLKKYG